MSKGSEHNITGISQVLAELCSFLEAPEKNILFSLSIGCCRAKLPLLPSLSSRCLFQCLNTTHPHSFSHGLFIFKQQCIKLFSHFSSLRLPFLPSSFAFCLPLLPPACERYLLLKARVMRLGLFRYSPIS